MFVDTNFGHNFEYLTFSFLELHSNFNFFFTREGLEQDFFQNGMQVWQLEQKNAPLSSTYFSNIPDVKKLYSGENIKKFAFL